MNIFANKNITNIVNNPKLRTIAAQMCNHKALLPVIMLESTVISGRTYQAYKRGGIIEARERMIDESLTALVWFGIISWLNAGFSKLIAPKGIFDKNGLPEIAIDLGKDAIRDPIGRAIKLRPEIQNKIGGLKFAKIAISALAGIYLSGLVLPKFYQSITRKILHKEKLNKTQNVNKVSMDDFLNKTSKKSNPSFGSANSLINTAAHVLENNPIAKLMTIDVGLFAGRGYSARNNDERIELLFRDFISSFFYLFSTPLVYLGLSKFADKFKGKNTNLDPNTANYITKKIAKIVGESMDIEEFQKQIFGNNNGLVEKIIPKFKDEKVISIQNLENIIKETISDANEANRIINNAKKFIKLRPKCASETLLPISEVINSIKSGAINDPVLLKRAVEIATKKASQNSKKFVSYKEIDKIKKNIFEYTESIVSYAKNKGINKITSEILNETRNRNLIMKLVYTVAGMAVSATFLSTIIPKIQYKITEIRTGKKEFPGIKDLK